MWITSADCSGMEIVASHPFRVTRNTDMEIQEDEADDLLISLEETLRTSATLALWCASR